MVKVNKGFEEYVNKIYEKYDGNGNPKYNYMTVKHAAICGNIRAQRYMKIVESIKNINPRIVSRNSRPPCDNHLRMKLYYLKSDKIRQAAEIGVIDLPRR